ncbi:restriction endonuclease subunit S [Salmonella enterica subsp. enterica serovar Kentucky]|uniref:Type I restriction modification DNA specificity domain-containing protein n=2 Tax=Enterobacteriaceae TaxID=543 RepID=A0A482ETZ6_ECOLX|nr:MULTISPECIES: restriction endonuclease subunit S [Enterobacteriaceae]EBF9470273.1 restriction endonuclease subunit S [Salmonella enterica subsp. enterica serovar Corvallis]EBK2119209.1 restriction endonuclease subunit S [Salmonella enterica subsp. enterica serovar Kentucky]EBO3569697.1 restriction endonuclease subunit S [Salmonella enterica subsp. enterica serovar Montevideo]EBS4692014.1 restriction endonuclease subunit S [Salmonella enterica subsp. enterica serovar Braenderup]EBW5182254.1 
MSELNYLEKLLDGVEVEWIRLGNLVRIKNGKDHKSLGEGDFPVYGSGGVMRYADTYAYDKPSVLIPRKGSLGNLFFVDVPFWTVDTIFYTIIDETKIWPKYLYYFLTTVGLGNMNQAGGVPSQTQSVLNELKIPIPCPNNPEKSLAIQSEIVRILDKFTALTAELTAELTARKKQYNYYRDQLLSFKESNVAWKTLGEISRKISSGGTPKTGVTEYYDGTIPWLRTQEVDFREIWDTEIKITEEGLKTSSAKWIPKDCIIIAMYGATVGKIGINKIPMTTNQACANIQLDEEIVHYRYVFHFLCSQYAYIKSLGTGSQTNINAQIVKNIKIPVPFAENPEKSLNEQLRIVNILDKFDTLTSSITEGLPREIELRQKQYEYYRDLLFSFPKPDSVTN